MTYGSLTVRHRRRLHADHALVAVSARSSAARARKSWPLYPCSRSYESRLKPLLGLVLSLPARLDWRHVCHSPFLPSFASAPAADCCSCCCWFWCWPLTAACARRRAFTRSSVRFILTSSWHVCTR